MVKVASRPEPWGRALVSFCIRVLLLSRFDKWLLNRTGTQSVAEDVVELAKPRFYLCLSCRFGDHAECRKGKCECECGSSAETASLSTRDMGVKRSKVVRASVRRRPLYTAGQLKLALEGRSA